MRLNIRVSALRSKIGSGTPKGNDKPDKAISTTSVFSRDPLVKAWILNHAKGVCEACGNVGPFKTIYGDFYLEVHHVLSLSEGGSDTINNTVALCPNCHRRCHQSADRDNFVDSLYHNVTRLNSES